MAVPAFGVRPMATTKSIKAQESLSVFFKGTSGVFEEVSGQSDGKFTTRLSVYPNDLSFDNSSYQY